MLIWCFWKNIVLYVLFLKCLDIDQSFFSWPIPSSTWPILISEHWQTISQHMNIDQWCFLSTNPVKYLTTLKQSQSFDQRCFQPTVPVKGEGTWTTALRDTRVKMISCCPPNVYFFNVFWPWPKVAAILVKGYDPFLYSTCL